MRTFKNLYHCSQTRLSGFEKDKGNFGYVFLSDHPIFLSGYDYIHVCDIQCDNVIEVGGGWIESWSYPLYLYLTNRDGSLIDESAFTPDKYDGYLGLPYEFWKAVYYDEDEYSCDEIPSILKDIYPDLDLVIMHDISEGDDSSQILCDYCVFDPSNITIKSVHKR